ncbi:MAG: UDP binding domain-containing protein, partial [Acidobacteriota bacterium]
DNATAEMIKYTSNSLLATLISFSNEIANVCATVPGVDVEEVMRGVHLDKRLSPIAGPGGVREGERIRPGILSYLRAGCGFGGSCLPKDVSSLAAFGDSQGSPARLLRSVLAINADQPSRVIELARRHRPDLEDAPVAVLGLAFKPGTSDIRETPALPIVRRLAAEGARLTLYDPEALDGFLEALGEDAGEMRAAEDLEDAVRNAAIVVVLTSWQEFQPLEGLLADRAEPTAVIDGRRMFAKEAFERYEGIGLGADLDGGEAE